jgi:hypothetical protein
MRASFGATRDDEWFVKLHGGNSQQYNYTGLIVPNGAPEMSTLGAESNLWDAGVALRRSLVEAARTSAAVLHYVAAIYNSALAEASLDSEPTKPTGIKIPRTTAQVHLAVALSDVGRSLRDMHRLLYDGPQVGSVERGALEALASATTLHDLGVRWVAEGGRRFKTSETFDLPDDWRVRLRAEIIERQASVDGIVEDLDS